MLFMPRSNSPANVRSLSPLRDSDAILCTLGAADATSSRYEFKRQDRALDFACTYVDQFDVGEGSVAAGDLTFKTLAGERLRRSV